MMTTSHGCGEAFALQCDIVMTTEASLGELAQLNERQIVLAQRLITLGGNPGVLENTYLRFTMQSERLQTEPHARASGTTVVGIRQRELRQIQLSLPSYEQQVAFAERIAPMTLQMDRNWRQTSMMTILRGKLLPKLLSGEMCIIRTAKPS